MSLEDSFRKRVAKCRKDHDTIFKQLPVVLEKMEALFPTATGNKMESSEAENNKSETKKATPRLPALTPTELGVRYKDLEDTVRSFLKDLDKADEKETGSTSQAAAAAAAAPPSVKDE